MPTKDLPPLPEFVTDHVGNEVRPGDTIVYAIRAGDTAAMSYGVVTNFQWPKSQSYGDPVLKIKLFKGNDRFGDPTHSLIEERHKRFAKIEPVG